MFKLLSEGKWEKISSKNSRRFAQNDITNDNWEIHTPENSEVPSIHVLQLATDQNGTIWAATFAGKMKMNE